MPKIVVSKVDVSRRQISAAVRMLFSGEDPIAVHTVAIAGLRIARDLAKFRDIKTEAALDALIKPELRAEFWGKFHRAANFFKHADKDPEEVLDSVDEEVNEFVLILSISCFKALGEEQTTEMRAFAAWFMVSHPRFFPGFADTLHQMARFVGFPDLSRAERLRHGCIVMEYQRKIDAGESVA